MSAPGSTIARDAASVTAVATRHRVEAERRYAKGYRAGLEAAESMSFDDLATAAGAPSDAEEDPAARGRRAALRDVWDAVVTP